MQHPKRGNPYRLPKHRRRCSLPAIESHGPLSFTATPPSERLERARLSLHEHDPITGDEEYLSSLCYEVYRGYTIYSTEQGRCCLHGKQGCLRLRGQFVCFPDIEEAKTLIKRFRHEGYTASDRMERSLPAGAFVWLNRHE
jgi:hypothetical protein